MGSQRRRGRRPVVKQSEAEGQKGDDLEHGASGSTEYWGHVTYGDQWRASGVATSLEAAACPPAVAETCYSENIATATYRTISLEPD